MRPYLADDLDRLLDAEGMAALLQVHPDTLVRWAREGRIWAKKVGKEWRFRADRADVLPAPGEAPPAPARTRPRHAAPSAPASFAAIRGR